MSKKYNFIDLFAGCGGFSEGFYMENYRSLLHLEIDKNACETLKERMRYYQYEENEVEKAVLCEDITNENILEITKEIIGENDRNDERSIKWRLFVRTFTRGPFIRSSIMPSYLCCYWSSVMYSLVGILDFEKS